MSRAKPTVVASLPETTIGLLLAVAGPETAAAAIPILRERMRLTPEKLALILVRLLNPDEFIEQGEEADLRGKKEETLRSYKAEGYFPKYVNGTSRFVEGSNTTTAERSQR